MSRIMGAVIHVMEKL